MEAARTSETSVDNHFTRQYNPEDSSEHHTRRRENLKSHMLHFVHQTKPVFTATCLKQESQQLSREYAYMSARSGVSAFWHSSDQAIAVTDYVWGHVLATIFNMLG
jgi:hypothetical protein